MNELLSAHIGKAVMIFEPDAYASDAALTATSDCTNTVEVEGYLGCLFILEVGDIAAGGTLDVAITYSSTGLASDAAVGSSAASTLCTDCVFAQVDSDGENEIYLLDIDLRHQPVAGGGILGAVCTAPPETLDFSLIAIPYGGTMIYPIDQENTVITPSV